MVATVGSISIDLSTNTAKFTQGFKGAATTVDQQSKRMAASVGGIKKSFAGLSSLVGSFGAGLAGGAAFAGLTSFTGLISKAREAIGRLDDIADRAKTAGIGTDLLQSLEHGARQAGLEVTDMGGALSFFAKGMGQAAEGTGRLFSGLLKLDPVLLRNVLNAKDQEERLRLVADALDKAGSASERAALSAALFGDVDFGRLFEGGAAAIDAMVKKAKDLDQVHSADDIKRAGEYDTKLNDIEDSTNKTVDALVLNLGPALVGTSQGFRVGIEAIGDYIENVDKLGGTLERFAKNPSGANLADVVIGPEGGNNVFDVLRGAEDSVASIRAELNAARTDLADLEQQVVAGFPVELVQIDIDKHMAHIEALENKLLSVANESRSAFAEAFREAENASMAALDAMSSGGTSLPNVIGGTIDATVDPAVMDGVEDAIDKETDATNRVAARATDVYRGVGTLDSHTAGYFDTLGSRLESAFSSVEDWIMSSGSGGGGGGGSSGGGGGGGSTFAGPETATTRAFDALSSSFSGLDSSSSWGGRQFTYSVGGDSSGSSAYSMDSGSVTDASSITSGDANINVSVVVKPVMEGTRLSAQSTAEIKQAAAAGANAALRAFNGR